MSNSISSSEALEQEEYPPPLPVVRVFLAAASELEDLAEGDAKSESEDPMSLKDLRRYRQRQDCLVFSARQVFPDQEEAFYSFPAGYLAFRSEKTETVIHSLNAFDPQSPSRRLKRGGIVWTYVLGRILDRIVLLPERFKAFLRPVVVLNVRESDLPLQLLLRDKGFLCTQIRKKHFEDPPEDSYEFRFTRPTSSSTTPKEHDLP